MKSSEYIKKKIDQLVNIFPNIKCSYEYDKFDNTHTVEILPSEFFELNELFYNKTFEVYEDFSNRFPFEGLYFIDNNVLYPVKNPIYTKCGIDYEQVNSYNVISGLQKISLVSFNNNKELLSLDNVTPFELILDSIIGNDGFKPKFEEKAPESYTIVVGIELFCLAA